MKNHTTLLMGCLLSKMYDKPWSEELSMRSLMCSLHFSLRSSFSVLTFLLAAPDKREATSLNCRPFRGFISLLTSSMHIRFTIEFSSGKIELTVASSCFCWRMLNSISCVVIIKHCTFNQLKDISKSLLLWNFFKD